MWLILFLLARSVKRVPFPNSLPPNGGGAVGNKLRLVGVEVLAQPGLLNVRITGGIQTFHLILIESDVERRHILEKLFGPAAGDDR